MFRILALAILALLTSCRHGPQSYHLVRQSATIILLPPERKGSIAKASSEVVIKNARRSALLPGICNIAGDLITLRWRGKDAGLTLKPESYFPTTADQKGESGARAYLDPLQDFERFRGDLSNRQEKGCLTPDEARRLLRAIVENFPMPPLIAHFVVFGGYSFTGFLDLTPDVRLQVVSPISTPEANPTPKQITEYDTVYYSLTPQSETDRRVRASLVSASAREGKAPVEKSAPPHRLRLPDAYGYFRLLFWTSGIQANHRAAILFSADQPKLDEATKAFRADPERYCLTTTMPDIQCVKVPANFAVNPEVRVSANGKEVFVSLRGTVLDAIRQQGRPAEVPVNLRVSRVFQGRRVSVKFDRASKDILGLVLLPGDEIRW